MERWQALIEACPVPPDLRFFGKAIQTAGVVLKEDLAPFEIEWILRTLLHKPVEVFFIVKEKCGDNAWSKAIGDLFRLFAELAGSCAELETHFADIVTITLLPFDAQTRKLAVQCATHIARVSSEAARDVSRHIDSLEQLGTCRAPLAVLVGTICEYHPVAVTENINRIWRIYLNLLDHNKNTDTITVSLLQGLLGLFKHFGMELPTAELNVFYNQLVGDYLLISRCEEVCLKILTHHANLFREKVSADVRTRMYLWNCVQRSAHAITALTSMYEACTVLDKEQLLRICTRELLPHTQSSITQVKYTSLRILTYIQTNCRVAVEMDTQTDVHTLQCELRSGGVTYDVAEAISLCLDTNIQSNENLLQTCMVFYNNLPATKRKDTVVHAILNAPRDLRSTAITYLTSETTMDATSLESYSQLWKDLFDTNNGKDIIVMEKSKFVFEDFMSYCIFVVESFLDDGTENLPERLSNLLSLLSQVLASHSKEVYTHDNCTVLLPLLLRLLKDTPEVTVMAAIRYCIAHVEDSADEEFGSDENLDLFKELCQTIRIDRCKDEALLCESCLTLIEAPIAAVEVDNVLKALRIIFSRNDVEPKHLTKSLKKLENIIVTEKYNLDDICDIIQQVEKLHSRKDLTGKDARILHRDVILFLGKFGGRKNMNNNSKVDTTLLVKLKDRLALNIPNPEQGTSYKINLQRIIQLALEHEYPDSLHTLLTIICANLSSKQDELQQLVVARVCHALCRVVSRGSGGEAGAVHAAIDMCASVTSVQAILLYISEEKSPGVRKMLSDALEELLRRDQDDALVLAVAEHATVMMDSSESTMKRAGLDITETLITGLKENNSLTKDLLPNILIHITKTFEIDSDTTFEIATKHFMEKIELFEAENFEGLTENLLKTLLLREKQDGAQKTKMAELDVKVFKNTTKMAVGFIKKVFDYKSDENEKILEIFFKIFAEEDYDILKCFFVLAETKVTFDFNMESSRRVLSNKDFLIQNKFLSMDFSSEDIFSMEVVLKFLEDYSEVLLEFQYEKTLQLLAKLITNISPKCVKHLQKQFKSCLSVYSKRRTPSLILKAVDDWCNELDLKVITENIEKREFNDDDATKIRALKIVIQSVKVTGVSLTAVNVHAPKWLKILLGLFSNDYVTDYLKSKMTYLTDLLTVSVSVAKVVDVKKIILEGVSLEGLPGEKIGVQFCRFFVHVFYLFLVRKPYVLLDKDMEKCSVLLSDIVKYALKKKCSEEQYENILELVDQLWPTFESSTTFNQKYTLLLNLNNFPKKLDPASNPLQWAVTVISSDANREDKARLISVLPGGDAFGECYVQLWSTLPARLSEMSSAGGASLRALLDATVSTGGAQLMDNLCSLAGGDDTKGWWDEAIDSTMASLAQNTDAALCKAVFNKCWDGLSLGVCRRVLLPLLRYSTPSFCEQFFSDTLNDLMSKLKEYKATNHYTYHKSITDCARVFTILQMAFEKVPPSSLESPHSLLYRHRATEQSWALVRETCKKAVTLRDKLTLPAGAGEDFQRDYRLFQQTNYNCLCSAICRYRPGAKVYDMIFHGQVWGRLVDDSDLELRIRHQWNQRKKLSPVSIDIESSVSTGSSLTRTHTSRTKMFLRTLSDHPHTYLVHEEFKPQEPTTTQDIELNENVLNNHLCASTLTALLCHVSVMSHTKWRDTLCDALVNGKKNTKWLLAQMICNCKEELKSHASSLRPALLDVVATTRIEKDGRTILNGLHVDILETLNHWGDDNPTQSPPLDKSVELLIQTCLQYRQYNTLYRTLLDVLTKFVEVYSTVVQVSLDTFDGCLTDTEATKTLQILQRISKSKVDVDRLLSTLTDKIERRQYHGQLYKMAELFGLAAAASKERHSYLTRYISVLSTLTDKIERRQYHGQLYKMAELFGLAAAASKDRHSYLTRSTVPLVSGVSPQRSPLVRPYLTVARLLSTLTDNIERRQYHGQLYKMAELFGLAAAASKERHSYLTRFRKVLDLTRKTSAGDYIKMLYYAQNGCPECCDEYNFRMTTDLTQKIVGPEKSKCLQILSTFVTQSSSPYIAEMFETIDLCELIAQDNIEAFSVVKAGVMSEKGKMSEGVKRRLVTQIAGYCGHSVVKVRKAACEVMIVAFQDLFNPRTEGPPAKKQKTSTSRIIDSILSKDVYACTIMKSLASAMGDEAVYGMLRDGLSNCLDNDMGVRFTECFLLSVYLPCLNAERADLSLCVSLMLEMLFSGLRSQQRFKMVRLRDEPLQLRQNNFGPSKLLTMSRTYQGTFRGNFNLTGRRKPSKIRAPNPEAPDIDVKIPIENILATFLKFAKDTPEVSQALCLQFAHALRSKFELGSVLAASVAAILDKPANQLTPFVVELAREFIDDICRVDGIKTTMINLINSTRNSVGELVTSALYDEIRLRTDGREQFILGAKDDDDDDVNLEESSFCLDDLTTAFGQLSNWNNLTIQQKKKIERSGLPPLWTGKEDFKVHLENYTATTGWFGKMVSAYRQEGSQDLLQWLREMDQWPRRHFIASAITEAIEWQSNRGEQNYFACDIQSADCLAEWAARFMIRTAYLDSLTADSDSAQSNVMLSRSHELVWCQRANERALSSFVMGCVKRNTPDLYENETLPWLQQKVWALRNMGVANTNTDLLTKALSTAETFTPRFLDNSSPDSIIGMHKMILLLHKDLNTLSTENLQNSLEMIEEFANTNVLLKDKESLRTIFELAVTFYDDLWESDQDLDQNVILSDMLDVLHKSLDSNIPSDGLNALILNRLDSFNGDTLREDVALKLLNQINRQINNLDDFTIDQLKAHVKLLPSRSHAAFPWLRERDGDSVVKYRRCLQLVCDAEHSLKMYCEALAAADTGAKQWKTIFDRMKHRMFENPYAGSEYQLLTRYKNKLYEIEDYEPTQTFKDKAQRTLKEVHRQLQGKCRAVLRLSQLCPALARCGDCPGKLLGLPRALAVVKVEEQVEVITDSIRRPTKLKFLLSNGTHRVYLHKSGEPLRVDASAQSVLRFTAQLWGRGGPLVGYHVTPLSEDCGLIEFLEDHERLRNVIGECCDLDAALTTPRPPDHQLILDPPQASLNHFNGVCELVPRSALRQGIARWSMHQQDYLMKLMRFQSCVAAATVLTHMLGLGDRHLQNLLFSIRSGGLCHVDWANVFQYGGHEVPPARLTHNILAACNVTELEAQLQQLLAILRDSHKLFCAVVRISFKWMGDEFNQKMPYITAILTGRSRSYDVTRDVIAKSDIKPLEKQKYIDLLNGVFQDYPAKERYDVEDQEKERNGRVGRGKPTTTAASQPVYLHRATE